MAEERRYLVFISEEEAELVRRVRESKNKGCSICFGLFTPINQEGWKIKLAFDKMRIKRYDDSYVIGISYCPFCGRYLENAHEEVAD